MANPLQSDDPESSREPDVSEAVAATEAYETEEGVVFYDAQNLLAWVHTDTTVALDEVQ